MPVNSRSGRIESFDVEEQSETSALHLYIEQLSPGPLHSSIEFVQTDGLLVYRQHLNRRIHASGASPDGYVMIGTTASRKSRVEWNGQALGISGAGVHLCDLFVAQLHAYKKSHK
jgi:hypothetical protein